MQEHTDTERLDFIQRTEPDVAHKGDTFHPHWWLITVEGVPYFDHSLREVIDQAMSHRETVEKG